MIRSMTPFTSSHKPYIIAGPCSAETREQVLTVASSVSQLGVDCFRAGVWKPRTAPGCFEGMGAEALPWLIEVQQTYGLRACTEVGLPQHIDEALAAGLDMFWIGARTASAPFAMKEIAAALQGVSHVEILIKNPISPDLALWKGAIERILRAGVTHIRAVFRGYTPIQSSLYRNIPLWHIPQELKQAYPTIPLICDPSHIAGSSEKVAHVALMAQTMGFNSFMIECHHNPAKAWSDAKQQITPEQLALLVQQLCEKSHLPIPLPSMWTQKAWQEQLKSIDHELLQILGQRMRIAQEIALYKQQQQLPAYHPERYAENLRTWKSEGNSLGLPSSLTETLYNAIHDYSLSLQQDIISSKKK